VTLWSALFPDRLLIGRAFWDVPATYHPAAPAGATFARVGLVGGGAMLHGAAYAFWKGAVTPLEAFTLVVGAKCATLDLTTDGTDTSFTRDTGAVLLARAKAATHLAAGTAAASTGTVKRDGGSQSFDSTAGAYQGGASGSDEVDLHAMGIGGLGAYQAGFGRSPMAGGGGTTEGFFYDVGTASWEAVYNTAPGDGRCCVEWYTSDPGY
jgi:hypothetical protein